MDLRFSAEELAFRDELRSFIRDNLPTDIRDKMRLSYGAEKEEHDPLAAHPQRAQLGGLSVAQGMGRAGLVIDLAD